MDALHCQLVELNQRLSGKYENHTDTNATGEPSTIMGATTRSQTSPTSSSTSPPSSGKHATKRPLQEKSRVMTEKEVIEATQTGHVVCRSHVSIRLVGKELFITVN